MSNELRLLFARTAGALTYRLSPSWGGDAGEPQPFVPLLTGDDYDDLRWYLEDYMDLPIGGAQVRAARVERSLGEWGKQLFAALFDSGDHRELFNALVDGPAPRLLAVGTKDLGVLRLPWELLADTGVRERYVEIYCAVLKAVGEALMGSNPRGGMEVMIREEANACKAVRLARSRSRLGRVPASGDPCAPDGERDCVVEPQDDHRPAPAA